MYLRKRLNFLFLLSLMSAFLFSCGSPEEKDLSEHDDYKSLIGQKFNMKQNIFLIKKQSGRETEYQIGIPGKTPWPSVEQYLDDEYKNPPSGEQIIGLLKQGRTIKISQVSSKDNVLSEEVLQFHSKLKTSQGKVFVDVTVLLGSYLRLAGGNSRNLFKENLYVKPLK
jgi:hypothetical protein